MTDLLLIVPHPDDEAFGAGALLARVATGGGRTAVLTLTRGAAGRTLGLCSREELPAVRERELRSALEVLGVADVTVLDHQDYVPDDDRGLPAHPGLAAVPEAELLDAIVGTLERTRPRVVLTFPPNGSNGHPDHVTTSRLVRAAVERVTQRDGHGLEALYYYAAPASFVGPQRPGFLEEAEMHARYLPPTHFVDAGEFLALKLQALGHHATQALSVLTFMRRMPERLLVESFHRAWPPVAPGEEPRTVERL